MQGDDQALYPILFSHFLANRLSDLIYYYQVSLTFTKTIRPSFMSFLIAGLGLKELEVGGNLGINHLLNILML